MRSSFLPFALPDLDGRELEAIKSALDSGWITTGPRVKQFEAAFARAVGARHAVAVNSCTAAMHLALEASGIRAGDIVLTTPYTFAATAEVVRYFDAVPVFVDVEPDTCNIDPGLLAETIDTIAAGRGAELPAFRQAGQVEPGRLKAVIPVHIGGLPVDLEAVYETAKAHGLVVIEDAAHAFPASREGHVVGSSMPGAESSMVCFSFYATKTITTGEGGMICTDSESRADRCRVMSLHGISRDAWKRYTNEGSWYYEIVAPGYKYNMTDVAAAMGLAQLEKAEAMRARRREIAARYTEAFGDMPELETPPDREDSEHAWHLYMLRLRLDRLAIDRREFIEELKKRNIGASVHFIPLHLHPYYRERYGYRPEDYPVAYREYQREISLPIYSRMTDEDVEDVIEAVRDVAEKNT